VVIAVYTLLIDGLLSHNKSSMESMGGRRLSSRYRWKDRLWELNCGILGLLLSQALAFVITQVLKNATGKPRPDLINRCLPRVTEDLKPFGLSNSTICQGDPKILKDGFRSWPSGIVLHPLFNKNSDILDANRSLGHSSCKGYPPPSHISFL
jgi:diacylglycerol diphosphate phosphatase / phosphatidate phosphatase